ncbi:Hypothetical predicted protein [Pelobates cultripes]|uniref:Uncharacterized protein n=1 Tax=Pelobates cultripes TaxID=61616 RepID=A0AAD1WVA8_PELCU|nr:Hypothetical predicted protein [Pelobates cultripes]
MTEATCYPENCNMKLNFESRLDKIFADFWEKLSLRQQQTAKQKANHHSLKALSSLLHRRHAESKWNRARKWQRRGQHLKLVHKPKRPSADGARHQHKQLATHHKPCYLQQPESRLQRRLYLEPRSTPTSLTITSFTLAGILDLTLGLSWLDYVSDYPRLA